MIFQHFALFPEEEAQFAIWNFAHRIQRPRKGGYGPKRCHPAAYKCGGSYLFGGVALCGVVALPG